MKKYLSLIITLAVLAAFGWYVASHPDNFTVLAHVSWWLLVLIAVFKCLKFLSNGLFAKYTAEAFTKKFSIGEGIIISIISAVGNFFGPLLGGLGVRAVYLNKVHGLPYAKFTSTLIGYYLLMFLTNSLLAIVSLLFLPRTHQTVYALIFFSVWFVAFLGLAFVRLPSKQKLAWLTKNKLGKLIYKVLYDIEEGWRVILSDKKLLLKMLVLALLVLVSVYLVSLMEFMALNIPFNWAGLGLYTALFQVSILLAITPDGVGIREGIFAVLASTIGISGAQIIQIGVIDRGVHTILLVLLFLLVRNSVINRRLKREKQPAAAPAAKI